MSISRNSIFKIAFFGLLFIIPLAGNAQKTKRVLSSRPDLVVGLILDQLRPDQIYKYWDKYSENGFKKLLTNGTEIRHASYDFYNTDISTGNAGIITGALPSAHGIVSNEWFELLNDKLVFCTDDPSVRAVGGSFENGPYSPSKLLVSGFCDELRFSNRGKSKVFGISLEHTSAILSSGQSANAAFWLDYNTGEWMTSSYYLNELPAWLKGLNEKKMGDIYLSRLWEPLLRVEENLSKKGREKRSSQQLFKSRSFPYNLEKLSNSKNGRDYSWLKFTPFGNAITMDMALSMIIEEELGKDQYPDYLSVNFNTTGPVAEVFGQESPEMEDVMIRFDIQLAHFIESLENLLGKKKFLIYLTASRGMPKDQKVMQEIKLPEGLFNRQQVLSLLKSYLNVKYGKGKWIRGFFGNQIYLNRVLIEDSNKSLDEMRNQVADFLVQFSGVSHAISASSFKSGNSVDGLAALVFNGYSQKRSGDVLVVLKPGWRMESGKNTGTGYSFDRNVPLIWYGWRINPSVIYRKVNMTDIAPTISLLLNIPLPDASSGSTIMELFRN
jgi:predicted AlkP superfamily pyrophosphatase or phosphodiesterase